MTRIKFQLDQHVSNIVAHGLRQFGVDVTTTHESGLQDADDLDHLAFAHNSRRVLVTHDAGFLARHDQGEPHRGIAYAPQAKYQRRASDLLQAVHLIYSCLSAEEFEGCVEFL